MSAPSPEWIDHQTELDGLFVGRDSDSPQSRPTLRDYQTATKQRCRELIGAPDPADRKKKILVVLPTGAGKSVFAADMISDANAKGSKVLVMVDRVALVWQMVKAIGSFGVDCGVIQGSQSQGQDRRVVVATPQSLETRYEDPECDLLVIDEAHSLRSSVKHFISKTKAVVIGLTATPFTPGLGEIFDAVINARTTDQLIKDKWLAPLKIKVAAEVSTHGLSVTKQGEWKPDDLSVRVTRIVGDVASTWLKETQKMFRDKPPQTLVYSATVADGARICEAFRDVGEDFRQISYKDSNHAERARKIDLFRNGEIRGLVSVDALAKGFDVPSVECVVMARPFRKSLSSVIQQIGRGMRISPGKRHCLILDHAGNYAGFFERIEEWFAEGCRHLPPAGYEKKARKERKERADCQCPQCNAIIPTGETICWSCGYERKQRARVVVAPGRMVDAEDAKAQIKSRGKAVKIPQNRQSWQEVLAWGVHRKRDFELGKKLAYATWKSGFGTWPNRAWGMDPAPLVSPATATWCKHLSIKYAKHREKVARDKKAHERASA